MRAVALLAAALAVGCATEAARGPAADVGAVVLQAGDAGGGVRFAGSSACRSCHPGAWERWRATGHAADFAGLRGAERADPSCLRCHVTGHGDPRGYGAGDRGLDLAAVGCEACHGPADDHASSRHPEFVPTATGGECPPCEANRICRLCHTPARSPAFDLERYLARVSCRGAAAPQSARTRGSEE